MSSLPIYSQAAGGLNTISNIVCCYSHGFSKHYGGSGSVARDRFDHESVGGFWSTRIPKGELITNKRFLPDGSVLITTRQDGKIVEQIKRKPHLIPVPDATKGKVELEPFMSVFEMLA